MPRHFCQQERPRSNRPNHLSCGQSRLGSTPFASLGARNLEIQAFWCNGSVRSSIYTGAKFTVRKSIRFARFGSTFKPILTTKPRFIPRFKKNKCWFRISRHEVFASYYAGSIHAHLLTPRFYTQCDSTKLA